MAGKASYQDIDDAGFRAGQFGTPADWDTPDTGYVARVLARSERWSRGRYGASYDDVPADTLTGERLRGAEICHAMALLWRARAAFVDSNAASSREQLAYMDRREYEASATRLMDCAEEQMALALGGEDAPAGTGAALSWAESGPFAARAVTCP